MNPLREVARDHARLEPPPARFAREHVVVVAAEQQRRLALRAGNDVRPARPGRRAIAVDLDPHVGHQVMRARGLVTGHRGQILFQQREDRVRPGGGADERPCPLAGFREQASSSRQIAAVERVAVLEQQGADLSRGRADAAVSLRACVACSGLRLRSLSATAARTKDRSCPKCPHRSAGASLLDESRRERRTARGRKCPAGTHAG